MSRTDENRRLLDDDHDPFSNIRNGQRSPSVDSRRPSSVRPSVRRQYFAAFLILIVELAERMTYYGLIANFILLNTSTLKYGSVDAVNISLIFSSVCYFMPVLGGFVSDACLGYFNTLYASGLMYIVGAACFPIMTFDYSQYDYEMPLAAKRALFILGLILIALGTGGIKSNVGPFGAEQLQHASPHATQTFFTWFYWFVNVGAFIAYGFLAYIQQEYSFFVGFIIPTSAMILGVIILVSTKPLYIIRQPKGSVLPKIFHLIYNAFKVKRTSILHENETLDYARRRNGGAYSDNDVDDVKALLRLFPVFLCCIAFWVVYNQMSSTFFLQGERMNLTIGSFHLPAASLNLFDCIAILVLAPIMDRIVYPLLDKINMRPSQLVRMGLGMILAVFAMIVAGGIEIYRKDDIALHGTIPQILAHETFNASSLSVLYQIPQFMLIGSAEIFLVMTGQEFAFSEAPESVKAAVMGIFLITNGFGSLLGSALINLTNALSAPYYWIPDEINHGHMENYCFMLAGIMFVNFLIYAPVAYNYKYNNLTTQLSHSAIYSKNRKSRTSSASSDEEIVIKRIHD